MRRRLATIALTLLVVLGCEGAFEVPTAPTEAISDSATPTESVPIDDPDPETPAPTPIPSPTPRTACWAPEHFGDFLTLRIDGASWYDFAGGYYETDRASRERIFSEIAQRGYTRGPYLNLFEARTGRDHFARPERLVPYLAEIADACLGAVLEMGPEDEPSAQQHYAGDRYLTQLRTFVPIVDPYVADYVLGVEVEEYWTREQVQAIGRQLRVLTTRPIWVHFKTPRERVSPKQWWESRKSWVGLWATGISFQYPKRDKKNGFLAHPSDVKTWTQYLVPKLRARGLVLLAGEYAYRRPEEKARALGALAIRYGAVGAMNGVAR